MKLVIDASVSLKWLLDPAQEADAASAQSLLRSIIDGTHTIVQPPHWLAEVLAVVAREEPAKIDAALARFDLLSAPLTTSPAIDRRAATISASLGHHLFDTLYHATALELGATLVTSDKRYLAKASGLGQVTDLIKLPI